MEKSAWNGVSCFVVVLSMQFKWYTPVPGAEGGETDYWMSAGWFGVTWGVLLILVDLENGPKSAS